jgi:hydrogenase expression/formation protein HypC
MCLGIAGEVTELVADNDQLAVVDVLGARRHVNIGMLEPDTLAPGDWVLIHVGFAMDKISKEKAAEVLSGLELLGRSAQHDPGPG